MSGTSTPTPTGGAEKPLVVLTIGTDHHPFDRLVEWVDRWLADSGDRVRAVLQHSTSPAPRHGQARAYLGYEELQGLMREASVFVCHAGAATLMECRRAGLLPVIVPRVAALGEVVDDHQVPFGRLLGQEGIALCCETEDELRAALDRVLDDPDAFRLPPEEREPGAGEVTAAVRRTGELIDALVATGAPRGRRPRRRRPHPVDSPVASPVEVVFLGGFGRSGSTLLERLLGELPDVCAIGEVTHLWERGLAGNERCGCGHPFHECAFWRRVGEVAYGGWDRLDAEHVLAVRSAVDRTRFIPELTASASRPALSAAVREYGELHRRLYAAVREVSGCRVVVDSSKRASLAFALRHVDGVDLRVLHVVRDSRGVAHSWGKNVRRPEVVDEESFMPTYSAGRAGLLWNLHNALFHLLASRGVPTRLVRYEDLLRRPREVLEGVGSFLGVPLDDAALSFLGDGEVKLTTAHTVAGNPMRFRAGRVQLRMDEAWREELPASRRRLVTALTLPLHVRYGYAAGAR